MATFILDRNQFDAVLFDLDGVLTDSAALHARSWKTLFDSFLEERDGTVRSFDADRDYRAYVNGKPRFDGIRSSLESRGVALPEGEPDNPPDAPTIHGLGSRKNALFLRTLPQHGVVTFPAAVRFLQQTREAGFKTALVSSSRNSRAIADKAGLSSLFDAWVDGEAVQARQMKGKPAPDMFQAAPADLAGCGKSLTRLATAPFPPAFVGETTPYQPICGHFTASADKNVARASHRDPFSATC